MKNLRYHTLIYLLLICSAASFVKLPCTTDILTPAFSKVIPSCRTHVIPPPPACLVHLSTRNLLSGSASSSSKARQNSFCTLNIISSIFVFMSFGFFWRWFRSVIGSAINWLTSTSWGFSSSLFLRRLHPNKAVPKVVTLLTKLTSEILDEHATMILKYIYTYHTLKFCLKCRWTKYRDELLTNL